MSYQPREGSVAAQAIAYLQTLSGLGEAATAVIADAIGSDSTTVAACLKPAEAAGVLMRRMASPRVAIYRLARGPVVKAAAPVKPVDDEETDDSAQDRTPPPIVNPAVASPFAMAEAVAASLAGKGISVQVQEVTPAPAPSPAASATHPGLGWVQAANPQPREEPAPVVTAPAPAPADAPAPAPTVTVNVVKADPAQLGELKAKLANTNQEIIRQIQQVGKSHWENAKQQDQAQPTPAAKPKAQRTAKPKAAAAQAPAAAPASAPAAAPAAAAEQGEAFAFALWNDQRLQINLGAQQLVLNPAQTAGLMKYLAAHILRDTHHRARASWL